MKNFKGLCKGIVLFLLLLFPRFFVFADSSIALDKANTTIGINYSDTLKYTLNELDDSDVSWSSSDEGVAVVDNGVVTGKSVGVAVITVYSGDYMATCRVTVVSDYVQATGISLSKSSLSLSLGNSETLTATISPDNATNKNVTWSSSNTSVATVDKNGVVTAVGDGSATITATSFSNTATCSVQVSSNVSLKGISLNKSAITIKEKSTERLTVTYNPSNATNRSVTWKSSNTSVATVDSNGNVTGVSVGSATIIASANGGERIAECKVVVEEVSKDVTSVSLDKDKLDLKIGEDYTLVATISPDYAENKDVSWSSSDTAVASVRDGKVTAKGVGSATITVKTDDGNKTSECVVTVTSLPIESISFKNTVETVYLDGKVYTLETVSVPENTVIEDAIWTSSDESVLMVADGVVTPLKIGSAEVTVSNENESIKASVTVIVLEKQVDDLVINVAGYDLGFDPDVKNYTLKIGNEKKLDITTNRSDGVTINGNANLVNGSVITINVVDDVSSLTYIITIKKKDDYSIYFIIIITILLLINLLRIVINGKKKKKI